MPTDQTKRKELWGRWVAALCARDLRRAEEVAEEMCDQDYVVHNPKLPDYGRGPAAAKAFAHYVITHYAHIHLMWEDFCGEGDKTAARSTVRCTVAATWPNGGSSADHPKNKPSGAPDRKLDRVPRAAEPSPLSGRTRLGLAHALHPVEGSLRVARRRAYGIPTGACSLLSLQALKR